MSYHRRYKLKDGRFGLLALSLRERVGLTQVQVATAVGVSERSIQQWEAGTAYPAVANLKKFIEVCLYHGAFVSGREQDEVKALWEQAVSSASRRKALFDEIWFDDLLRRQQYAQSQGRQEPDVPHAPSLLQRTDWGEAIDVPSFYGREEELLTLKQWVGHEHCRVVMLLGMGGIGKSTLSIRFAQEMLPHVGFVFWRSLRNAPPLEELLVDCIQALSEQKHIPFLHNTEKNILLLIDLLRKRRCLLVLDNVETLLQAGSLEGSYRQGYESYGRLFQHVAETAHQSCLLLTSREMLEELEPLEGTHASVRVLKLGGLGQAASQELLADKDLFGTSQDWQQLIQHYSGNPLALKMVAATVRDLFGGDLAAFLREGPVTLHTLRQLLEHQFARLVPLEQAIMYWLAIERDLVSLETLRADLPEALSSNETLSAIQSLRRRCLVERGERGATFTLQPEVMEYVSERLVEQMCEEIIHISPKLFMTHALMKAQSNDYLRESQIRMLVQPLLKRLQMHFGDEQEVERQLSLLVRLLQEKPSTTHGYAGGNLVNLLTSLKGYLNKLDFSSLAIRQAYLQGIEAQDANFAGAHITEAVFMEPIESIASMALSPDGVYLAVGSFSGQIRLWRVADRKPLLTWQGHSRMVWALAFSLDSTILASGGYDHHVKLWEVQRGQTPSGRCLRTLSGHERWVRSIAFSPDGTLLATTGDDETIRVWETRKGTCQRILHGHSGIIWSIAFSPDSTLLISGALDETVRVWDTQNGACLNILHGHTGMVMAVAFHPSGDIFASGDESGHVKLWDARSRRSVATLQLRTTKAASTAFNAEGTLLAVGSQDGAIEIWHLANKSHPSRLRTLLGHPLWVSTVAFGPNNFLVSISYGGKVKLWDVERGRCLGTLQGYSHVICAVSFSPDGNLLVHGDDHGMLRVWDVHSGRCRKAFQGHEGRIWSVVFSPDGKTIASGGDDQVIKLWKVKGEQEEECEQVKTLHGYTTIAWSVTFSPDGSLLASSGFERTVKLWKIGKEDEEANLTLLEGHTTVAWSVAFSPDGRCLASSDDDGIIKVWAVESGQCLTTLQSNLCPIGALAFNSDGNMLLSSSNDETITLWDRKEGCCHKLLQSQSHVSWTRALAFNQDGTMLAIGSDDHSIRIWHREETSGIYRLRTFSQHGGQVWSVAFSPDNRLLASGDDNGTVVLWNVETGTCRQILRSDRPYERMNIHGVKGITPAQRSSLRALGAIEEAHE
ncbi:MAG TPA: helix-turn-helix domain-containing protein [Ktedonobacteraceae bacterium]|nr:helix-turn-helix domain-containing protein [Ktedonobacteraceae bacterium]